jgi:hypothetical protein
MELNHINSLISDKLEKAYKLTKNGPGPGEDNLNSELFKNILEEFKLRLLQLFNNI